VIAAGRIIQQGSYDELANQDGWFANLLTKQDKTKK
jgi:ABC-type multidrug transport system fused ATPase/permease subunit